MAVPQRPSHVLFHRGQCPLAASIDPAATIMRNPFFGNERTEFEENRPAIAKPRTRDRLPDYWTTPEFHHAQRLLF